MPVPRESLFRVFHSDYRTVLWRFFANRHDRITPDLATEFANSGTLGRMLGLELLEYDGSEYRLDDRVERFIEDMLGAAEVAPADWLMRERGVSRLLMTFSLILQDLDHLPSDDFRSSSPSSKRIGDSKTDRRETGQLPDASP